MSVGHLPIRRCSSWSSASAAKSAFLRAGRVLVTADPGVDPELARLVAGAVKAQLAELGATKFSVERADPPDSIVVGVGNPQVSGTVDVDVLGRREGGAGGGAGVTAEGGHAGAGNGADDAGEGGDAADSLAPPPQQETADAGGDFRREMASPLLEQAPQSLGHVDRSLRCGGQPRERKGGR